MLHLFNKVYVSPDLLVDINYDRVVISEKFGVPMLQALDQVAIGELVLHGTSLTALYEDERIGNFAGLINFIEAHGNASGKRLMIFLDDTAFMEFISSWSKFIFQQATVESGWKIVSTYLERERMYQSWRMNSSSVTISLFPLVTQPNFEQIFAATTVSADSTVYSKIKNSISLEYLIASYLFNQSCFTEVANSLKNILTRSLQEILLEVKYNVYKNQYKSTFDYDIDIDFFKNSTLFTSPVLGRVGAESNIDIANASDADIAKFVEIATLIFQDWEGFKPDSYVCTRNNLFQYVRRNLTQEDLNYLLNLEKTAKSNNRMYSTADEEMINIYLLDYILKSQSSALQPFLLR